MKSEVSAIFQDKREQAEKESNSLIDDLYRKIGKLNIKLNWMKKNLNYSTRNKCDMIDEKHPSLSIQQQCNLLSLSR